jgi:hypothetical protein
MPERVGTGLKIHTVLPAFFIFALVRKTPTRLITHNYANSSHQNSANTQNLMSQIDGLN